MIKIYALIVVLGLVGGVVYGGTVWNGGLVGAAFA